MNHEHKKHKKLFESIKILISYLASFTAAYYLTAFIYHFTGNPPEILKHLFTMLLAIGIIMTLWRFILQFSGDGHHRREYHQNAHDQLTDALAQIACGDFGILLEPDHIGMYNDLAEAINKMAESLGTMETQRQDFISNVSHEIQSPLTSISGFAALLKTGAITEEQRVHYLDVIETESKRLSKLSDNLLKLSNLESQVTPLTPKEFRLDKQIEGAVLMLEPQWVAKNIVLDVNLEKTTITADEELLNQVWINLLHNAIKFTPDSGTVTISLESNTVKIADNGIGIPETDQIHIFERFYKADKSRDRSLGGNGLGLSLCKKIIELHGGTITLESEPSVGTTFTVSLKK